LGKKDPVIVRCFVAIDIPQEIKSAISGIIRKIGRVEGIRWVSESNMHLTLKFLGEVGDTLVPDIEKRLRAVGARHRFSSTGIRGTGAFPNLKRPNVLWVGLDRSEPLEALAHDIESELAELGFAGENRPFSPHLTIGRVRDLRGIEPALRELSTYKDTFFGTIEVGEILLMKSVLKPSGAEYSKEAVIRLTKE
jgi:RNA 2',3'-cyclic 3'-phosphodiesterase